MEPKKKIKVFVATPTTGSVVDSQAYILRDIADLYKDDIELVYPPVCVRRIFHDHARNKMVEEFLATDCDILWFLDSDVTPPLHIMDLILLHGEKWKLAGATYPVFMSPYGNADSGHQIVFTCYQKNPDGSMGLSDVPSSGTAFVDGLATGCLFIRREVFSQLSKPYFEFKYDSEIRDITEGEDLGFVLKTLALGYKYFTDFSLVCKHQKSVDLLDLNNYAIEYSNRSILRYDAMVQEQVKEAIKAAYQKGLEAGKAAQPKSSIWLPK